MRPLPALTVLAVVCLGVAWLLAGYREGGAAHAWARRPLGAVQPESGHAFVARLPSGAPDSSAGPVHAAVFEDGRPLAGDAAHAVIRSDGGGRFSFWSGTLYFSASDNTDPRRNGRSYEVAWPSRLWTSVELVGRLGAWVTLPLAALGWLGVLLRRRLPSWRAVRPWLLRLSLVPASLLAVGAAAEIALRVRYPFAEGTWPSRFVPEIGFTFEPGATVRQTNLFDFCVEQRVNGDGFLDREHALEKPAGTARVAFLGDSFVEAVQVELDRKFHVEAERHLRAAGRAVETLAFGMSGCGTSNELSFYRLARRYRPDVVAVLVVSNDFANNSPLLESVRNGWHPYRAPRLFFEVEGDGFRRVDVDEDWARHVIFQQPAAPPTALDGVLGWSRTYRWVARGLEFASGRGGDAVRAAYARRIELLRQDPALPEVADRLAGWRYPDDLDPDTLIATRDPPRVAREAVALTEHALRLLRDQVAADGARLLVIGCHHLGQPVAAGASGRAPLARGWLELLEPICARLGLPLLDLRPEFDRRGVLDRCTFRRDGHWNADGHAAAGAAVAEWLLAHPEWLGG